MKKKVIISIIILLIVIVFMLIVSMIINININPENVKLYFLRLDDADCSIIKHKDNVIIIDTGEKKDQEKIEEQMQKLKISNIDYLILTHPDKDHIGNASYLLEKYNIRNIIQTDYNKQSNTQNEMNKTIENTGVENLILKEYKQINIEEIKLEIYPPEKQYEDSNNNSLVVLLKYKDKKVLYTGDIREERIQDMIDKFEKVDILKYPYHGRKNEYSKQFIEKTQPEFVIITGTEPDESMVKKLNSIKSKIRLTSEQQIEITLK